MTTHLGTAFAREIAQQPERWRALAASRSADTLRAALVGRITLVGSGSSHAAAALVARWLRAAGQAAFALPATDDDRPPFASETVVAFSQSGRSRDVLAAVERLAPARCVAVTNDPASPLAQRADTHLDLGAGRETAVPATKSVTATLALARLALDPDAAAARTALRASADAVADWLGGACAAELEPLVAPAVAARGIIVAGSGDGAIVAREVALKLKEAAYRCAEGVAAGEFRHGGVALFDPQMLLVLVAPAGLDRAQRDVQAAAERAGAAVAVLAGAPGVDPRFAALGAIVAGQCLALAVGRRLGIDGDAPRGISKVVA